MPSSDIKNAPKSRLKASKKTQKNTISSSPEETDSALTEIDKLLEYAGLTRHRRKNPGGVLRRMRYPDLEVVQKKADLLQTATNGVKWLSVPGWEKHDWLWHGFSTRQGGVSQAYALEGSEGELNLGFTEADPRENVLANRRLLAEAVTGSADTPLVLVRQFHSNVLVTASASNASPCKGDGLMTNQAGSLIGIQTADCIPVIVADRKHRVVAAIHAGWRGTVKRIVENGLGRMRLTYNSQPEDLIAAIGPGIGACCYAIGDEVQTEFESQFSYASDLFREVYDTDSVRTKYPMLFLTQRAPGHSPIGPNLHVDLIEANRRQLMAAGVEPENIQIVGGCTHCQPDLFFSHRGSKGHCGRMLSVIGIRTG